MLNQLMQISLEQNKSLEALLGEAIEQYLQTYYPSVPPTDTAPLIGLYEGSPEIKHLCGGNSGN